MSSLEAGEQMATTVTSSHTPQSLKSCGMSQISGYLGSLLVAWGWVLWFLWFSCFKFNMVLNISPGGFLEWGRPANGSDGLLEGDWGPTLFGTIGEWSKGCFCWGFHGVLPVGGDLKGEIFSRRYLNWRATELSYFHVFCPEHPWWGRKHFSSWKFKLPATISKDHLNPNCSWVSF